MGFVLPKGDQNSGKDNCQSQRVTLNGINEINKALLDQFDMGNTCVQFCIIRVGEKKSVVEKRKGFPNKQGQKPPGKSNPSFWIGIFIEQECKYRGNKQHSIQAV